MKSLIFGIFLGAFATWFLLDKENSHENVEAALSENKLEELHFDPIKKADPAKVEAKKAPIEKQVKTEAKLDTERFENNYYEDSVESSMEFPVNTAVRVVIDRPTTGKSLSPAQFNEIMRFTPPSF